MTTATDSFSIEPGAEPLPGYRLEKRIGSGGYGDVWKAIAPGGIPKAIKVIHGEVDGDRAVRELRSLDRAKSLNHPFLLSIERIEIVDGHLLIVTELADATLRDRFEQCRAEGLAGIPRDELLDYMREAADALDYLFDSHALQHLDIKPENLLLRAKHVKVADFGLLKNLQESSASLVSGMTPKYSAPELFEGKPGRHSDQYSLAIVYHEMVSGGLPFSGSNIASLASQHLHAAPDLSALVPVERFAVGKALSKDPRHRFPSCRAFVERLMHRSASMVMPDTRSPAGAVQDRPQSARQKATSPDSDSQCHDGHTSETAAPEIRELPRLLPPEAPIPFRPVLFVGIGGTGGRVLRGLRQLITDRLGDAKGLPAIQFLYVDTDEDGLASVIKGPSYEGLDRDEILIARLRQTQDYRNAVVSTLDSISRRWIYNVPRSLRTQGLRALGRLAFLDNVDRLLDSMRRAVINATHSESVAATADQSGLSFSETDPRVFVVASIGGGTGSGMVLDAGYAIRQVLAECGFTDDYVCGFLTYTSGSGPVGVAPANAFACLEELRYFAQPGCEYPGEPKCGLAGFRGDGATFRSTYLFDVHTAKSDETTTQSFDQLAEYLFLSAVSPASALLDESRRREREESPADVLRLRTAGICPLTVGTTEDPAPFAEQLCRLLVRKWSEAAIQSQVKPANGLATRAVKPSITATSDQLSEILKDLNQLADKFEAVKDGAGHEISKATTGKLIGPAAQGPLRMADVFANQQGDLIEKLNQGIERQFFQEGRGLREILLGGGRLRDDLAAHLRATARRLVWRAYHHSVHQYLGQTVKSADTNALIGLVGSCLQNARPGLLDLGGAKRLLLAIPMQPDIVDLARLIEQVARERVSVSFEQEGDVKLCYEIEDLPWEGIQNKLIRQRHDCRELAGRLHTRTNIDWTIS